MNLADDGEEEEIDLDAMHTQITQRAVDGDSDPSTKALELLEDELNELVEEIGSRAQPTTSSRAATRAERKSDALFKEHLALAKAEQQRQEALKARELERERELKLAQEQAAEVAQQLAQGVLKGKTGSDYDAEPWSYSPIHKCLKTERVFRKPLPSQPVATLPYLNGFTDPPSASWQRVRHLFEPSNGQQAVSWALSPPRDALSQDDVLKTLYLIALNVPEAAEEAMHEFLSLIGESSQLDSFNIVPKSMAQKRSALWTPTLDDLIFALRSMIIRFGYASILDIQLPASSSTHLADLSSSDSASSSSPSQPGIMAQYAVRAYAEQEAALLALCPAVPFPDSADDGEDDQSNDKHHQSEYRLSLSLEHIVDLILICVPYQLLNAPTPVPQQGDPSDIRAVQRLQLASLLQLGLRLWLDPRQIPFADLLVESLVDAYRHISVPQCCSAELLIPFTSSTSLSSSTSLLLASQSFSISPSVVASPRSCQHSPAQHYQILTDLKSQLATLWMDQRVYRDPRSLLKLVSSSLLSTRPLMAEVMHIVAMTALHRFAGFEVSASSSSDSSDLVTIVSLVRAIDSKSCLARATKEAQAASEQSLRPFGVDWLLLYLGLHLSDIAVRNRRVVSDSKDQFKDLFMWWSEVADRLAHFAIAGTTFPVIALTLRLSRSIVAHHQLVNQKLIPRQWLHTKSLRNPNSTSASPSASPAASPLALPLALPSPSAASSSPSPHFGPSHRRSPLPFVATYTLPAAPASDPLLSASSHSLAPLAASNRSATELIHHNSSHSELQPTEAKRRRLDNGVEAMDTERAAGIATSSSNDTQNSTVAPRVVPHGQ